MAIDKFDLMRMNGAAGYETLRDFCGMVELNSAKEVVINNFPEIINSVLEEAINDKYYEVGSRFIKELIGKNFVNKYDEQILALFNDHELSSNTIIELYSDICTTADKFNFTNLVEEYEKAYYAGLIK